MGLTPRVEDALRLYRQLYVPARELGPGRRRALARRLDQVLKHLAPKEADAYYRERRRATGDTGE